MTKTLKHTLKHREIDIRDKPYETMVFVDMKGKVHHVHSDKKNDSVYVDPKIWDKINKKTNNNTIMTHNHPYNILGQIPVL